MLHCCVVICTSSSCIMAFAYYLIGVALLAPMNMRLPSVEAVVFPSSNCYALDNSNHLVDFTDWIGNTFEYDGKDSDLVVRFCKDVERRSQAGYVDFGHFMTSRSFIAAVGPADFVQRFYEGDLMNCEYSYDKMGRTAQVNIICGNCINGSCKGELGCICSISFDKTMCSVTVELAIPCPKSGNRVFKGFTVGFHPRSAEVVYNGMTLPGFEKLHDKFSFQTEQTHVSLYLTAVSSLSRLVGKPSFKVNPSRGLEVTISGSGARGVAPTALSPTILEVDWRCDISHDDPYEVNIVIPVDGYEPVEFSLTKTCGYTQGKENNPLRGWVTFGIVSCILVILPTAFCCGGLIYKIRVEHQHGLYALPGMTFLSACLETVSRPRGDVRVEDFGGDAGYQGSRGRVPQVAQRTNESYGSM